jgi:putative acetyltransferase
VAVRIERDDLTRPEVHQLLADHLADMRATSPAESVHALDLSGLRRSDVTMWTLWGDDSLLGCAALRELTADEGEIKSMRTVAESRGRGLGRQLLAHVIAEARTRGYRRLSLETGTQEFFAAARRLYERHGFRECPPFGNYRLDPNSVFMTREL